jgi:hypothetical protein
MSQEIRLRIRGLFTHSSDLSAVPEGALSKADNIVIDRDEIAEPRRGFNQSNSGFSTSTFRANKLFAFKGYVYAQYSTNKIAYYTNTTSATFDSSGAWTVLSGNYSPPSGVKMRVAEANQNLYLTTSAGVYKMDAYNSTPVLAGAYKGLDIKLSLANVTGNWLAANYRTAYRVVWGYRDANNNLVLGAPSQRVSIKNTAGATRAVALDISIPSGVTVNWFYQVYRAAAVDNTSSSTEPNDEMGLVYEANPASGDLTNGYVTFNDITPDELRGATIYTAATQQGLAAGNEQPPMCKDIAAYKNVVFYANTTSKHRQYVTLLAAGGSNGLVIDNTITIGGVAYTAKAAEATASAQFRVYTSGTINFTADDATDVVTATGHILQDGDIVTLTTTGTLPAGLTTATDYFVRDAATNTLKLAATLGGAAIDITTTGSGTHTINFGGSSSQNIRDTALSLVRTINRHTSSTVYAYYMSGTDDLPGKILLEERAIGGTAFTTASNNTTCWSPAIGSATETSTNDRFKNGIFFSKNGIPEAVPLGNYFFAGSADKEILRILPLRDSLFILKEDGIYRLSGEDASSFRIDLFDSTAKLLAPETAVVLNNQIFALTDQGVASITEAGVQVRSRPIESTLLNLQGINATTLENESFGISYETERKYILFVPRIAGDTTPTQAYVFNTFTNAWTRWTLEKTCGIVNPADNKLYMGDANSHYVNQERKSYSFRDYVDYRLSSTISAASGTTVTLSGTSSIEVGDVIYQSDSVYAIVDSVNTGAGTVTTSFTAAFTAGAATVYKAINSAIAWVPITMGNPGVLKQFREATLLFKTDFTGDGSLIFTSDTSPSRETETVEGTDIGSFGLFAFGAVPWGGEANRRPIRTLVPRNKQRCTQLTVEFAQATGYAQYQLNGISLIANSGSERVSV